MPSVPSSLSPHPGRPLQAEVTDYEAYLPLLAETLQVPAAELPLPPPDSLALGEILFSKERAKSSMLSVRDPPPPLPRARDAMLSFHAHLSVCPLSVRQSVKLSVCQSRQAD
jgi:hypothetical protein